MYLGHPHYISQLNDISFWYPILEKIGMRTPETKLFYVSNDIGRIVDGEKTDEFNGLVANVDKVWGDFGYEAFLRTGQTSNKHDWDNTCYLGRNAKIDHHLYSLIEFSMMVDLPYNTFAVRKMIDTTALTIAFQGMPIAREVRLFAEKGRLICAHPYWPEEAFEGQDVDDNSLSRLQEMPDMTELTQMAEYVSKYFEHAWSIDFLEDVDGKWWLTDMALASTSYHWPNCPNAGTKVNDLVKNSPNATPAPFESAPNNPKDGGTNE